MRARRRRGFGEGHLVDVLAALFFSTLLAGSIALARAARAGDDHLADLGPDA